MVVKNTNLAKASRAQKTKKLGKIVSKPASPPAAPKPRVKAGGRQKGTQNTATISKEEALQAALGEAFAGMTEAQLQALCKKPLEVLELLLYGALKARSFVLARGLAQDILPYREAKLVAPPPAADPDAPPIVFEIRGGLPQKMA